MARDRPLIIGLTGGVGAGKSTVAGLLAELGCVVYDADEEVSHALADPDLKRAIASRWGPEVLDRLGAVDRRALAQRVFADERERRALEGLVHPRLGQARQRALEQAVEAGAPAVVYDAPLLVEAGLDRECDALIFIESPLEARLERVRAARGWSQKDLQEREAAQIPLARKRDVSQYVVVNDADLDRLRAQTRATLDRILAQSASGRD